MAAALLADNVEAQKVVIAEAIRNLEVVIQRIPNTTIKRMGPHV